MKTCLEIDDIVDDYYTPTPCCMTLSPLCYLSCSMTLSPHLCHLTILYDTVSPFILYNNIQLMTFHNVDTVIYQPRGSDVHRRQRLR